MKSMTAFARQDDLLTDYQMSIEMKTVNHRYLDVNIRLPECIRYLEIQLREMVSKYLSRGRVDIFIKLESLTNANKSIQVNESVVESIRDASFQVGNIYPALTELSVADMLNWKGVLEAPSVDEKLLTKEVEGQFKKCLESLVLSRANEGEKTNQFLLNKVEELENLHQIVIGKLPEQSNDLKQKIKTKLDEIKVDVDADRFEQEVVYYLNRMDVNEEVERIQAHLKECRQLLSKSKVPVGRKLDFMMQELQREANTLGTKSTCIELKNAGLEMKVIIEQIREQVQNIE